MRSSFHRCSRGLLVALALVAAGLFQVSALAQEAPSQIGPVTPLASECTVEPRTAGEMVALYTDATPASAVPGRTDATIVLGNPADAATSQQITAVIHQAFACLNAGDFGRFFALVTDQAMRSYFPWVAEMVPDEAAAAQAMSPNPPTAEFQQSILGIGGIAQLPDGRASAVVVGLDPNAGPEPMALYLTFVEGGGVWRIDGIVDFMRDF